MNPAQPLMTLMFVDVTGSAQLYAQLNDLAATQAIKGCLQRIRQSVERWQGQNIQITGDELYARFISAEAACQAAIDTQKHIADLAPVSGFKLTVRIGLHCGLAADVEPQQGALQTGTARLAGRAAPEQILLSEAMLPLLPAHLRQWTNALPALGQVSDGIRLFSVSEIVWQAPSAAANVANKAFGPPIQQLCLRYRAERKILAPQAARLSIGRDPASDLLIEDRKASRHHGKIEYRAEGYFYIDSSSNGSFLTFVNHPERLLRNDEMLLQGRGRICFGSSGNEPHADCLTFEHL